MFSFTKTGKLCTFNIISIELPVYFFSFIIMYMGDD